MLAEARRARGDHRVVVRLPHLSQRQQSMLHDLATRTSRRVGGGQRHWDERQLQDVLQTATFRPAGRSSIECDRLLYQQHLWLFVRYGKLSVRAEVEHYFLGDWSCVAASGYAARAHTALRRSSSRDHVCAHRGSPFCGHFMACRTRGLVHSIDTPFCRQRHAGVRSRSRRGRSLANAWPALQLSGDGTACRLYAFFRVAGSTLEEDDVRS
mmetsp:Transcript_58743/g.97012  ORF Transcript_58743/g.97012 Transcript_58743/m.97012 type:complete len:211 (-) Transcript_58743:77-709(-)